MAPENFEFELRRKPIRNARKGDVWGLGCIVDEVITGRRTFASKQQITDMTWNKNDYEKSYIFGIKKFEMTRYLLNNVFAEEEIRWNISQFLRALKV